MWNEMSYNKINKKNKNLKNYDYPNAYAEDTYGLCEDIYEKYTYAVEEVFDKDSYDEEWN